MRSPVTSDWNNHAIKLRKYRASDFERLYEIDHEAFSGDIAYSHAELQYYLRSRRCRAIVAEDDGEVVAFVIGCSEPRMLGHVITIDVLPEKQGRRLGSHLLREIEEWLWASGAEAIYLETAADDQGAAGFYDKHGYFVLERIEGYYNGRLDALVMMKLTRNA